MYDNLEVAAVSKTVIITGGTKGIGAAIARVFYNDGFYVVLGSRQNSELASQLGDRARFVKMDVCRQKDHQNIVKVALNWTGKSSGIKW